MGSDAAIQAEQKNKNTDQINFSDSRSPAHLENVHNEVTAARLSGNQPGQQPPRESNAEIKDKNGNTTQLSFDGDIYNSGNAGKSSGQQREASRLDSQGGQSATAPANRVEAVTTPPTPEGQSKTETPALSVTEFGKAAKELLPKLDKNHDGKITERELGQAMGDPSITGKDAQVLAALYHNFKDLSRKHGGQDSITVADIDQQFSGKVSAKEADYAAHATKFGELMHNHPEFVGEDKDPSVSKLKSAINTALGSDKYSDDEKQTLKYYQDKLKDAKDDPKGGDTSNQKADPIDSKIDMMESIQKDMNSVAKNENSNTHELYKGTDAITPDAVKQNTAGDCYLEASIAAVAKNHPELIKQMIADNHDGTYTVTFPGDKQHPVTVTAPTGAESGLYNQGSEHGIWPGVLEKAYGQWQKKDKRLGSEYTPVQANDSTDYDGHGGGYPSDAIHMLTGNSVDRSEVKTTSHKEMAQKLEDAIKNGKCITIASPQKEHSKDSDTSADGIYKDHIFTVVGFTPDGHGGGTVTIRNPWGDGNGKSGTFTMPLEKVMNPKNFEEVAIESGA